MSYARIRHGGILFLGAALLAGCAAPQQAETPPPQPVPPAPVAQADTAPSVDGLYHGTSTRYLAQRRDCPHPGLVDLYVQGGRFAYRWNRDTDVNASVGPDGTVTGQEGMIALTGRLVGTEMEGDLSNGACSLHFVARRRFQGA